MKTQDQKENKEIQFKQAKFNNTFMLEASKYLCALNGSSHECQHFSKSNQTENPLSVSKWRSEAFCKQNYV